MKIYSCPKELPAPEPDFRNYDSAKELAREEEHQAKLKAHLIAMGYNGSHTGEIIRSQIADGYACYMMADGSKSCLIHLPYGDGYNDPNIQYVPKKEILRRAQAEKNLAALFAKARAEQTKAKD